MDVKYCIVIVNVGATYGYINSYFASWFVDTQKLLYRYYDNKCDVADVIIIQLVESLTLAD